MAFATGWAQKESRLELLTTAFDKWTVDKADEQKQKDLFYAFPDNFADFCTIFRGQSTYIAAHNGSAKGHTTLTTTCPNLSEGEKGRACILSLDSLTSIDRKDVINKYIKLSMAAYYAPDAIALLQERVRTALYADTDICFELLHSKTKAQQVLFWQFVWQSIHMHKGLSELRDKVSSSALAARYPDIAKTMQEVYATFAGEQPIID